MSTEFMGSATPPPVHPEPVEGSFEDFCKRSYVEALQMSDYKRGGPCKCRLLVPWGCELCEGLFELAAEGKRKN